jgi:hypothetical protein
MVVNFRAREISRGARKLARTPTLNYIKKKDHSSSCRRLLVYLMVLATLSHSGLFAANPSQS